MVDPVKDPIQKGTDMKVTATSLGPGVADHPVRNAVVYLGILGSYNTKGKTVAYKLSDQVHSFRYDIIGKDSFKFDIELINYDERFAKSLVEVYSRLLDVDIPKGDEDQTVMKEFPKLLIQFGYEDHLSNLKVAQIQEVVYRFNQNKEKILVIKAVDVNKMFELHANYHITINPTYVSISNIKAPDQYNILDYALIVGGEQLHFWDLLVNIITKTMKSVNQTNFRGFELGADLEKYRNQTDIIPSRYVNDSRASKGVSSELLAASKILRRNDNYFNRVKFYHGLKTALEDLGFKLSSHTNAESLKYLKVVHTADVAEQTGSYGAHTSYISSDQIYKDAEFTKVVKEAKPQMVKIHRQYHYGVTDNIDDQLLEKVNSYNERIGVSTNDPLKVGDPSKSFFLVTFTPDDPPLMTKPGDRIQTKLAQGKLYVVNIDGAVINDGEEANPLFINSDDVAKLAGTNTTATTLEILKSVAWQLQKQEQVIAKNDLNNIIKDEYLEGIASFEGELIPFDELEPEVQLNLRFENLAVSFESPNGESTTQSIENMLSTLNSMLGDNLPKLNLKFIPEATQDLSFDNIFDLFENRASQIRTNTLITNDSMFKINMQKNLPTVYSFPNSKGSQYYGYYAMSYGDPNSVIKYFQFSGDNRYLANLLTSVASENRLSTISEHLTEPNLRSQVLPMVSIVLSLLKRMRSDAALSEELYSKHYDHEFGDYQRMTGEQFSELDSKLTDLKVQEDLEAMQSLITKKSDTADFTVDDFKSLGILEDFIEVIDKNKRLRDEFQGSDYVDSLEALRTFIQVLGEQGGVKSLFTEVSEEVVNSGNSVFTAKDYINSMQTIPSTNPVIGTGSIAQKVVGGNIYDSYSAAEASISRDVRLGVQWYAENATSPFEVKVKTLGIPEFDSYLEISVPRVIYLEVHDPSSENIRTLANTHWLSGLYVPLQLSHKIDNRGVYTSEFTLIKPSPKGGE